MEAMQNWVQQQLLEQEMVDTRGSEGLLWGDNSNAQLSVLYSMSTFTKSPKKQILKSSEVKPQKGFQQFWNILIVTP